MRHLKSGRKLNRTASHRKAMLMNLAVSLLDKERVTTTVAKAKEVRSVVERLITYGKKGTLHHVRLAAKTVHNKNILKKIFDDIAPGYKDRMGGYTRIIRLKERKGDNAELSIIELVGRHGDEQRKRKKKKKAVTKKAKPAAKQAPSEAVEAKDESQKIVAEEPKGAKKVTKVKKGKKEAEAKTKKAIAAKVKKTAGVKTKKSEETKAEKMKELKAKKTAETKTKKTAAKKKKVSDTKDKKSDK